MNQELAKKLQDADFPGTHVDGVPVPMEMVTKRPTLSQIIEACGKRFGILQYIQLESGTWMWRAFAQDLSFKTQYETAEEAAGELWIAINKKAE